MTRLELSSFMPDAYPLQWTVLAGPSSCAGCLQRIETGRRALHFGRGGRDLRALEGLWFHSHDCLARAAQAAAARESEHDGWRAEPYDQLERWARAQARERRMAP